MPKCRVISGPYFPVFSPSVGKYGPERNPYSNIFHAVWFCHFLCPFQLQKWFAGTLTEFNFEYMIDFVAERHNMLAGDLTDMTRKKLKEVLDIDIHSKIPLTENRKKFDMIITRFCLDSCSPNLASYNEAVKNLMVHLKKDGYFLQMGFFDNQSLTCSKVS